MMITYDTLLEAALDELPEFKDLFDELMAEGMIDKETGNHIVFSYVFVPVIAKAIKRRDRKLTKKMYGFLEKMASSDDSLVVEVCDYSVLEALNDEFSEKELINDMGTNTLEGYRAIKQYLA